MKYYIYYQEDTNINYVYLLLLQRLAKYNTDTKCYDTITYENIKQLTDSINEHYCGNSVSQSTVSRVLNNEDYKEYFIYYKTEKKIQLLNNFSKSNSKRNKFIVLNEQEAEMLIQNNDNLLCTYYCYLKYYCGYSKSKEIDTTAKQFFSACGYKESGRYKTKLSEYNKELAEKGYINIKKYRDNNGHLRNVYSFN